MKAPAWFRTELADLGPKVVRNDMSRSAAADRLTDEALKKENRAWVRHIVWTFIAGKVRGWVDGYLGSLTADEIRLATGQLPLPCLDLPALLEVGPGRFVHQNQATRDDLRSAIIQAQTKEKNAKGYADKIRDLAAAAIPLMTDDTVTLADIAPKLAELAPSHA